MMISGTDSRSAGCRVLLPSALLYAALLLCLAAPSAHARGSVSPLSAEQRSAFRNTPEDRLDKKPCMGTRKRVTLSCRDVRHYVRMNEWYHDIWRPYVTGVGGGYVGIASDQNLTFIAWGRIEYAWLMDYDPVVVRVNLIHQTFLRESPDIASFLAKWERKGYSQSVELLNKSFARRQDRRFVLRVYRTYRNEISGTFKQILRNKRRIHWLQSAEDYTYLRQMVQAGRIRVMKGDLLKNKSLIGIGEAARKLGVSVRVVYLSNAEEFWPYPKNFRDNFVKLPMDEKTVVLRTRHTSKYGPRIGSYVYIVQGGKDFQMRLADKKTKGLWTMMRHRRAGRPGFFTIGIPVRPETMARGQKHQASGR